MTKIINLFAGPGAGKSTMAAGLFYNLKMEGLNVELVFEYAKDLTWEQRTQALANQIYVFGKQYHRIYRLLDKIDIIITDSPLLLCLYYGRNVTPESFKKCVLDIVSTMDNENYFISRVKRYNPNGRNQTESEAQQIDHELLKILVENEILFLNIRGDEDGLKILTDSAIRKLK